MFIVLEGLDGSGKSLQAALLADRLTQIGRKVILTSEPSAGQIGQKIRLLKERLDPSDELKLFMEDRRDHVDTVILPALGRGEAVVCDRYFYSTAAYQGASGVNYREILENSVAAFPEPDLLFLLSVPLHTCMQRISKGRSEGFSIFERTDFLKRVQEIYDSMEFSYLIRIDGSLSPQQVHESIWSKTLQCFEKESRNYDGQ